MIGTAQALSCAQRAFDNALPTENLSLEELRENEVPDNRDSFDSKFNFSDFKVWHLNYLKSLNLPSHFINHLENSNEHELLLDKFRDIYTLFIAESLFNFKHNLPEINSYELIRKSNT